MATCNFLFSIRASRGFNTHFAYHPWVWNPWYFLLFVSLSLCLSVCPKLPIIQNSKSNQTSPLSRSLSLSLTPCITLVFLPISVRKYSLKLVLSSQVAEYSLNIGSKLIPWPELHGSRLLAASIGLDLQMHEMLRSLSTLRGSYDQIYIAIFA